MHTICDYQILLRMKYALLMINHQLVTQKSMLQVDTYTHTHVKETIHVHLFF